MSEVDLPSRSEMLRIRAELQQSISEYANEYTEDLDQSDEPTSISVDEASLQLAAMSKEQAKALWIGVFDRVDPLGKQGTADLIDILVGKGVGNKRPLGQDWSDHRRKRLAAEARAHAEGTVEAKAAGRYQLDWDPEYLQSMVRQTEHAMHQDTDHASIFRFGGRFCRLDVSDPPRAHAIGDTKAPPPKVVCLSPYDRTSAEFRIRQSVAVVAPETSTKPARVVPPPAELITGFLGTPVWEAPTIEGLEVHPLILADGSEIHTEGLHRSAGLYLDYGGWDYHPLPDAITQEDARWAVETIQEQLYGEFEFESDLDRSCAVALLMTGFSRRLLGKAPAFLVSASRQGSGKTTLCQMSHITCTGLDMPVLTFSADETEAQKTIFASLSSGVHTLCYDNIPDGQTLGGTSLAAIITAGTFTSRVLGESRTATVPTTALILATGNNVGLDADLARRVITVRLAPTDERPEQRTYQHPDVYAHCLRVRRKLVLAVMTIVAGYLRDGAPHMGDPSGMVDWDRLVRYPLMWSGGEDPIMKIEQNRAESPVLASRSSIAIAGRQCFGDVEVSCADILREIAPEDGRRPGPDAQMLRDALEEISDRATRSARSLGRIMVKTVGHVAGGIKITRTQERFVAKYGFRKC